MARMLLRDPHANNRLLIFVVHVHYPFLLIEFDPRIVCESDYVIMLYTRYCVCPNVRCGRKILWQSSCRWWWRRCRSGWYGRMIEDVRSFVVPRREQIVQDAVAHIDKYLTTIL